MTRVYVGTSGWSYKSWEAKFYPVKLSKTQHFAFYATHFPTVEIKLTFYRLPTLQMVQAWRDKAPAGFVYALKGSRSEIVYLRFHGLEAGAAYNYTRAELDPGAEHVRRQAKKGKRVFAFFNNDVDARAPANAKLFGEMVRA